ncbi:Potassium voltage-gated channel subfamily KQT member 1, partial [Larimichthys crocea]
MISLKEAEIKHVRSMSPMFNAQHLKRGTKRRLKSRGNGSVGVASERAVSIPQITYDHIDDSVEKKDVSFFPEEPRGAIEGITRIFRQPVRRNLGNSTSIDISRANSLTDELDFMGEDIPSA